MDLNLHPSGPPGKRLRPVSDAERALIEHYERQVAQAVSEQQVARGAKCSSTYRLKDGGRGLCSGGSRDRGRGVVVCEARVSSAAPE